PLDVGVFGPMSRAWSSHATAEATKGITINQYNFILEYLKIWHVMTPELIQTSFCLTGIHPLNPDIFTDKDFAPSKSFSNQVHVPSSFPDNIPSSPSAAVTTDEDYIPYSSGTEMDGDSSVLGVDDDVEVDDNEPKSDGVKDSPHFPFSPSLSNTPAPRARHQIASTLSTPNSLTYSTPLTRSASAASLASISPASKLVPLGTDSSKSKEELLSNVQMLRDDV
ncbi:hypothetical protein C0991_011875, partial [Blastosporella zonata]